MGTTKHTPGPWMATGHETDPRWQVFYRHSSGGLVRVAICDDDRDDGANARLIAAAPDLLDACKAALNWLSRCGQEGLVREEIEKTVKKAEGGEG